MSRPFLWASSLVAAIAFAGPAFAQYEGGLRVSAASAEPGSGIVIGGAGFAPGAVVTITFESQTVVLGAARADRSGAFSRQVTIPEEAEPGRHTVRATGEAAGGGILVLSTAVTVPAEPTRAGATGLLVLVAVLGLAAVGGALLALRMRRAASG